MSDEFDAKQFVINGITYLRKTFPEKTSTMTDDELKNKFIDQAEFLMTYDFDKQSELMTVVDILWRLPDNALESPSFKWLREIIMDDNASTTQKIENLNQACFAFEM